MIYLDVPFAQKEQAKKLGARWDPLQRKWYVPENLSNNLASFSLWLPPSTGIEPISPQTYPTIPQHEPETQPSLAKGQSLSHFLQRVSQVLWQNFPGAQWLIAELSHLSERRGHLYLELSETDAQGNTLANARAVIWKTQAANIQQQFQRDTQMTLSAGQKLLMLCEVQFHSQYGLSLVVHEIDSRFSLGELEQKIKQIRQRLQQEGLYRANKQQVLPTDFFRIAVVAPPKAAGLGDFKVDAEQLSQHKLCDFTYFFSSFQGENLKKELLQALSQVLTEHQKRPYDALVIIRGGGAKLDLHQLNEYEIAARLSQMPMPVLTGIGHERDSTLLDEVAHSRFDTPSKVIHFIWQQIQQQAQNANQNWHKIQQYTQQNLNFWQRHSEQNWQTVQQYTQQHLARARQQTQLQYQKIQQGVQNQITQENQRVKWLYRQIIPLAQQQMNQQEQQIEHLENTINQHAYHRLQRNKQQLHDWMALILNSGPNVQQKRGFVIVSNAQQQTVTHCTQAQNEPQLWLHFQDGALAVHPNLSNAKKPSDS
ncbi:MAG: exodeoxyribonuclease VII large subunit [Thiotrichales bacterium]|nr:exodeoxyribonuclease VII large subunit [Thiotrichales bacterium]